MKHNRMIFIFLFCVALITISNAATIYINEVMPVNVNILMDDLNEFPDSWVELYNSDDKTVNLQGWYLSDDPLVRNKWKIDTSFSIPANGYKILYLDNKDSSRIHVSFKLDDEGGSLFLSRKDGLTCEDSITYPEKAPNISFGRITDGGLNYGWFTTATPGESNSISSVSTILAPVPLFSTKGGIYKGDVNVSLSLPREFSGLNIFYTTDGSEPTEKSEIYSQTLSFSKPTTLRARVIDNAYLPRISATQSYIVSDRDFSLPVLSITTDSNYLYDQDIGIFVWGRYYTDLYSEVADDFPSRKFSNLYKGWHRPMNVEYFDGAEHSQVINQLAHINVSGAGSRYQFEQKSFVMTAEGELGKNRFYHKFFGTRSYPDNEDGYKSIEIRNGGNDCRQARLRDVAIQSLYDEKTNADCLAYQPAVVFINGNYYGIGDVRERSNTNYLISKYNLDENEIDLFVNYDLRNGNKTGYNTLMNMVTHGFTYEQLDRLIDIDNYMRYIILYLFAWNTDWPGNNYIFWKPQNGKFRWIIKDLDFGFGLLHNPHGEARKNSISFMLNPGVDSSAWSYTKESTLLFRRVLNDKKGIMLPKFIDYYLVSLGDLLREDVILKTIDSLANTIRTEYPFHAERWKQTIRFTPKAYRSFSVNTPEMWEEELEHMKKWVSSRIVHVYDSLSSQFSLGNYVNLEVSSNINSDKLFNFNSISVHYPLFNGKWPVGRPLRISVTESNANNFDFWEIRTVTNEDTSAPVKYTDPEIDISGFFSDNNSKILVRAIYDNVTCKKDYNRLNSDTREFNIISSPAIDNNTIFLNLTSNNCQPVSVMIYSLQGKLLFSSVIKSGPAKIDISGISSQMLFLNVSNRERTQIYKVLKK